MPRFDGTGPLGTGPIGRGMGPCGGGQAWGRGRGFFRGGFGWWTGRVSAPITNEKEILEKQKEWFDNQLNTINQRLKDMEEKKGN